MTTLSAVLSFISCIVYINALQYVTVQTTEGTVQGKRVDLGHSKKSVYKGSADVFLGIPYAQPPIREKRFMPPDDPQALNQVYNATYYKTACYQPSDPNSGEDCLYLNVFTQNAVNYTTLSAVIVFIDGNTQLSEGGLGQQEEKGIISNFVTRGVVVVTIQYRLGPLGFFSCANNVQVTSNLGMLDQVKAMQWVNRNIASFGGDPKKVSLAGQAGGACAVAAHTYSPMSQGLFQQAILQSGSIQTCYSSNPNYDGVNSCSGQAAPTSLQYDQGLQYSPLNGNENTAPPQTTVSYLNPNAQQNQITNPSQLLATQLCNITPEQWRTGQLNGLRNCLQNYTVDVFSKTDGIHTATWMIVRDNLFLNSSLGELARQRPPIPLIIGTVQDEDADYAFKLVNAANNGATEGDVVNNWFMDFAKKNKMDQQTANEAKQIISQNYNINFPSNQSSNQQMMTTSYPNNNMDQQYMNSQFYQGQPQNQNQYFQTTTPRMIYGGGSSQAPPSPVLRDQQGRANNSAILHTLSVITNVSSDAGTVSQVVTEIDSWVQGGSRYVHVYRFEHRTQLGTPAAYKMLQGYEPVAKGQDKLFLFMREDVWSKAKPTTDDKKMADTMGQRWTDFAKQGSVPGWNPVQQQSGQPTQANAVNPQTSYCSLSSQPVMQTGYGNNARQVFNDQVYPIVAAQQQNTVGAQWNNALSNPTQFKPQVHVTNNGGAGASWSMSFSLNDFQLHK